MHGFHKDFKITWEDIETHVKYHNKEPCKKCYNELTKIFKHIVLSADIETPVNFSGIKLGEFINDEKK